MLAGAGEDATAVLPRAVPIVASEGGQVDPECAVAMVGADSGVKVESVESS
jgi:hypothetical protein